jgi:hypothetical protein
MNSNLLYGLRTMLDAENPLVPHAKHTKILVPCVYYFTYCLIASKVVLLTKLPDLIMVCSALILALAESFLTRI